MAKWILFTLAAIAFAIVEIGGFIEKMRRKAENSNVVHAQEIGFWVGTVLGGAFLFFAWNTDSLAAAICFCVASLLGSFLLLNWQNNAFIFDENGFTERNLFGKTKRYTYDQVSGWQEDSQLPGIVFVYVNEKKIGINRNWKNGDALFDAIEDGCRRMKDHQEFPEIPLLKKGEKGFASHVYRPQDYYLRFGVLIGVAVSFGVMCVMGACRPANPGNLMAYETVFYEWETQEGNLILRDWEVPENFVINGYDDCLNALEEITKKVDEQKPLAVWVKYKEMTIADPHYRIFAIASEDGMHMTVEEANRYDRTMIPLIAGIFAAVIAVILGIFGLYYAVGSNPKRYPEWLVYRLFKKDKIKM